MSFLILVPFIITLLPVMVPATACTVRAIANARKNGRRHGALADAS